MDEPGRTRRPDPLSSDEARNERLHTFAHDLKNRMGALWEALRLVRELPDGPEREEVLAFAERNFFNGQAEVERLMDDFRVPRDPAQVQQAPVELRALIAKAVQGLAFRFDKKQQTVEVEGPEALTVQGDAHLLEQLFDALLSNASKFSPRGACVRVTLRTYKGHAVAAVQDPGVGLTDVDLGRVFVRYALLSSRSTDGEMQARGTLARARRWAQGHRGTLDATSPGPGQGATFTVRLPLPA
ncbi:MAG: HAMP domain-containing histidine kinase [Bacteroidetes bacterium]|nr:HAMP domain-containing histidine kinase [Bacteroidota bacterium]